MEFTYQTITKDGEIELPRDFCHIHWQTADGQFSGVVAIPVEAFVGCTEAERIALVEGQIRDIVKTKIEAATFNFTGTATVEA